MLLELIVLLIIIFVVIVGCNMTLVKIYKNSADYCIGEDIIDEMEVFVDTNGMVFKDGDIILVYSKEKLSVSPPVYKSNIIKKVNGSWFIWKKIIILGKNILQIVDIVI